MISDRYCASPLIGARLTDLSSDSDSNALRAWDVNKCRGYMPEALANATQCFSIH